MSHYIHHVPGRLRVSARIFRSKPQLLEQIAADLESLEGIDLVTCRQKAGSITVMYDTNVLDQQQLLARMDALGAGTGLKAAPAKEDRPVGELAQRALFGTLVQLTVERSVRSLVGAIL